MPLILLFAFAFLLPGVAAAATPAEIYRAKCNVCHDSGASNAPRLTDTAAWAERARRGRNAIYAATLQGIPNSPMAAKGGFAELTDAEVRAVVDYMLATAGQGNTPLQGTATIAPPAAPVAITATPTAGASLAATVAEQLRITFGKPDSSLDAHEGVVTIRGLGIKVEAKDGVAVLSGAVHDAALIDRAEALARQVPGVRQVVNRIIAAAMLDFD